MRQTPFDGYSDSESDILKPRWLLSEGSKRDGSVSFAGQVRSAMRTVTKAFAYRRRLCADHFRLNSSGEAFPLGERKAQRFRNSKLVSFDPGHLDVDFSRSVPKISDEFHPPNQLLHRLDFHKEAIVTLENLHAPHDFACSLRAPARRRSCVSSAMR